MLKKLVLAAVLTLPLVGCGGPWDNGMKSSDPVERGCSYIALAIITSAIIRAICNK